MKKTPPKQKPQPGNCKSSNFHVGKTLILSKQLEWVDGKTAIKFNDAKLKTFTSNFMCFSKKYLSSIE